MTQACRTHWKGHWEHALYSQATDRVRGCAHPLGYVNAFSNRVQRSTHQARMPLLGVKRLTGLGYNEAILW